LPNDILNIPQPPSHLSISSILSRISFAWASGLITKGEKKVLRDDDVDDVAAEDQCDNIDRVVEQEWARETKHSRSPSLALALVRSFSGMLVLAQSCRLIQFACTANAPLILRQLITYLDAGPTGMGRGLGLIVAFFLNQIGFSLFIEHSFHSCSRLGRSVRTAMCSAIFKKSLSISNKARQKYSSGELTTLMSVNASQAGSYFDQLSTIMLSPFLAVVIFYRLFNLLGMAAVFALTVMLVLIPTNLLMTERAEIVDKERMKKMEKRMKLLTEVLNGIKVVKLNGWEGCFGRRVMLAREEELDVLRRFYIMNALFSFSWTVVPYIISVVTFAAYVYLTGDALDAKTAFVVISYLNILNYSLNETSLVFLFLLKIKLHLGRIQTFLLEDDHKTESVSSVTDSAVEIQNGAFTWNDERAFVLKSVDLEITSGSLTAVVGPVGAGKSSLLSAILGEMERLAGHVYVKGRTAYLPQQAWIQNDTLQRNILFGGRLAKGRYEDVLEACALTPDLAQFPGGDQVEIGEKGINLSGGQKQRVSLARAVYSDADVLLLDDPLSAVDNHVARHIFRNVISNNGFLKNKTRLLVTHNMSVLPHVDHILVVSEGSVVESGTYSQLLVNEGPFTAMLKPHQSDAVYNTNNNLFNLENSPENTGSQSQKGNSSIKVLPSASKIISEEETRVGGVSLGVYRLFLSALGGARCLLLLLLYGGYYAVFMYANIWLTRWVEDPALRGPSAPPTGAAPGTTPCSDTYNQTSTSVSVKWTTTRYYLAGYAGLGVIQALLMVTYTYCQGRVLISAARTLHHQLLENVLRSPMSFFASTPIGRITSRFSGDLGAVDTDMTNTMDGWLNGMGNVVGSLIMICYIAPSVLGVIIPMFLMFMSAQRGYISTTRQLTRMSSQSQAPMISFFSEAASGTPVILALGARAVFWKTFAHKVDSSCKFSFFTALCNRWLTVRLNFIGNVVLTTAIATLCLGRDVVTGGSIGLIVSFAVEFGSKLVWFVVNTTRLELNSVSVERIFQYTTSPTEATWTRRGLPPPHDWPRHGDIEFRKLSLRYREGLDLVLRDVSFKVKQGEKIGIVGRTGAGKSSLMLSLFRLVEPTEGAIFVDGIDISTLGLHELRSKIAVIPQDPVLFTGSLRMNLDPEGESSNTEIWTALEHTRLKQIVEALPHQLLAECGEGGQNFSVGQRQLLCLARTLLKKTRILVLDEATAAVDMVTDDVIQETIRREFPHCTILTIAHRLNIVMDYDRILAMDSGQVSEFDTPSRLLENTTGTFYCLARSAGIVS
ncbi:multidrug resistance-associated protein 1-like, partial [Haliotis cracherodii]|uniref:multidrug resistance-associated protein 1-like n=1 Tax=Haliotis cracherodii TaxID=6455 RepID=UPI0039E7353E